MVEDGARTMMGPGELLCVHNSARLSCNMWPCSTYYVLWSREPFVKLTSRDRLTNSSSSLSILKIYSYIHRAYQNLLKV
jgi:hypothetical protein